MTALWSKRVICCIALFGALALLPDAESAAKSKDDYKQELERLGIAYSQQSFKQAVEGGQAEAVDLFIRAGMNNKELMSKGLLIACFTGNEGVAELLLNNGADANKKADIGSNLETTPLMMAAENGNAGLIKLLLKKGADPNTAADVSYPERNVYTPLAAAAVNGNLEVVGALLGGGAQVNAKGSYGETALIAAALGGYVRFITDDYRVSVFRTDNMSEGRHPTEEQHRAVVGLLLKKGADVNAADKAGYTALFYAAENGRTSIMQDLIKAGAKIEARSKPDETPLMRAAYSRTPDAARVLLDSGADMNAVDKDGTSAVSYAAHERREETVKFLISRGARVNIGLVDAAANGLTETVAKLLASGAKVNEADEKGNTALIVAAEAGKTDIVRMLLKHGANVNAKNQDNGTALVLAIANKHPETADLLVKSGAGNVKKSYLQALSIPIVHNNGSMYGEQYDEQGFQHAVLSGELYIADVFLKAGMDINAAGWDGTALTNAAAACDKKAVEYLLARGAAVKSRPAGKKKAAALPNPLFAMVKSDSWNDETCPGVMKLLIQKGADPNAKNDDEYDEKLTPLVFAVEHNLPGAVESLIAGGAKVNAKVDGYTPLQAALESRNEEIAGVLIETGADVNLADSAGSTPLMYAVNRGMREITELLLARGARLTPKNRKGYTALKIAEEGGDQELIDLLKKQRPAGGKNSLAKDRNKSDGTQAAENRKETVPVSTEREPVEVAYEMIEAFHKAAETGDTAAVEKFLKQGLDPNEATSADRTPLMSAAAGGQTAVARMLLAAGADVNRKGEMDWTPLMLAAGNGHLEMVKLLVEKGADVAAINSEGRSAGRLASDKARVGVIKYLREKGYNPEVVKYARRIEEQYHMQVRNSDFSQAVKDNNKELVLLFIKAGIDLYASGRSDYVATTAIEEVMKFRNRDMAKLLIENGYDVNKASERNLPLFMAAEQGDPEMVKLLLKAGANVKAKNEDGETVLNGAMSDGNGEVVKLLIEAGADMYDGDSCNMRSALHHENIAIVRVLLEKGYALDRCEKDGSEVIRLLEEPDSEPARLILPHIKADQYGSLLVNALLENNEQGTATILKKKPNLRARDRNNVTVLMAAAINGNTDLVKSCLTSGADVNALDEKKRTAIMYAIQGNRRITRERDGESEEKNGRTEEQGRSVEIVKALLEKGAKVNTADEGKATPLMYAAGYNMPTVTKLLLEKGAEVNAAEAHGATPLLYAVNNDMSETVALLLSKGADVNAKTANGDTALKVAQERKNTEIEAMLKKAGEKE